METIAAEILGIGCRMRCNQCLPDHKSDDRALHSHAARTADFPFFAPNPPIKRAKTRARVRFVDQRVARKNRRREDAVRVEAAALRPLPARRATDFTEIVARVTRTGGFMVHNIFYSAPSGPAPRRMDADAFRRAVVDGDEDCHLAMIPGEGGGHVGSPHRVDRLRNDRAVMTARAAGRTGPGRRRQAVLPHQPPHPPKGEPPPPASSRSIFACDTSRARPTKKARPRQRAAASTTARSPAGLEPGAWDRPWTGARSPPATRPRPTAPARARRGFVAPEPHVQAAQTVRTACASVARQCFLVFMVRKALICSASGGQCPGTRRSCFD